MVVNSPTIKPLDADAVRDAADSTRAIVVLEEHSIIGGLGSAVAEVLARFAPVPMEFVGVEDQYGQSGEPAELLAHFGMDVKGIMDKVRKVIKRKK